MLSNEDRIYYAGRAEAALRLAASARDPGVRSIHLLMAAQYRANAAGFGCDHREETEVTVINRSTVRATRLSAQRLALARATQPAPPPSAGLMKVANGA